MTLRTKPDTGTAHTPGPWETDSECGNESVLGPDGFMVADCAIFSMRKGAPTAERNQANARLIAAAPELLAVLRALMPANVARLPATTPDSATLSISVTAGELRKAMAAIAKAEGRS